MTLEEQINQIVGEVRTDTIDVSFGEISSLHSNKELIIQPEYQRLFRWSPQQKSHLIESILLELPIPQIFVIENSDGVLELVAKPHKRFRAIMIQASWRKAWYMQS